MAGKAPPAQAREVWDRAEFLSAAAANNALLLMVKFRHERVLSLEDLGES